MIDSSKYFIFQVHGVECGRKEELEKRKKSYVHIFSNIFSKHILKEQYFEWSEINSIVNKELEVQNILDQEKFV